MNDKRTLTLFLKLILVFFAMTEHVVADNSAKAKTQTEIIQEIIDGMVAIPGKNYKIGRTEVTKEQYDAIMVGHPLRKEFEEPMDQCSWEECQLFIGLLNNHSKVKASGLVFRLPTHEEWEYACRAGAKGEYCKLTDGKEIRSSSLWQVAWYSLNSEKTIHPVGQKSPNAFGLYDMLGNVAEWTSSTSSGGGTRLLCGGWWNSSSDTCSSSSAFPMQPHSGNYFNYDETGWVGFRLCADTSKRKEPFSFVRNRKSIPISNDVSIELQAIPGQLWFGRTEITQDQWMSVMGNNPSEFKGKNNPVENVSWDDCQAFIKRLNSLPSVRDACLVFRLPTYSEWSLACLAGGTNSFCKIAGGIEISSNTLDRVAWFKQSKDDPLSGTRPVGQKQPNAFGLYDMLGNVDEWTATPGAFKPVMSYSEGRIASGGCFISRTGINAHARLPHDRSSRNDIFCRGFRICAEKLESKSVSVSQSVSIDLQSFPNSPWFGKTEVTQALWETVMGENPSFIKGENNPVERVSWNDCQKFLEKLNDIPSVRASGLVFRLPTEEEWRNACRAGTSGWYCRSFDGTEIEEDSLGEVAWFGENSAESSHPVGQKKSNAFGLYDMNGNVCEWTSTNENGNRVVCSGGWGSLAKKCQFSHRVAIPPSSRLNSIGFRICGDETDSKAAPSQYVRPAR